MPLRSALIDMLKSYKKYDKNILSLSRYFPKGTSYFYGYPSGEESGFLNRVSPAVEELVSARPLACAGNNINVVTFAQVINQQIINTLSDESELSLLPEGQVIRLPRDINVKVEGQQRNTFVKQSLKRLVKPGCLVMAQPFLDDDLHDLYQISPRLSNWLNDKQHMHHYVPENLLPKRYAEFKNGQKFIGNKRKLQLPCVVKVSSSSAGDGVYICKDVISLDAVKAELKYTSGAIIVEQYIDAIANHGIQFGIPQNPELPIDIIGVNQQLTTPEGEFIGGIIDNRRHYKELAIVKQVLLSKILPEIRKLGWYGVGCFDVLTGKDGSCYLIDGNFRMTGMTAYLMMAANNQITRPLASFNGEFQGTLAEFKKTLNSLQITQDMLHILTLTQREKTCGFNAALLFDNYDDIAVLAETLLSAGIVSKGLKKLAGSF